MEKHQFKVIYSYEDDVYRILDLTDTSIVGVTEMYETDDEFERKWRAEKTKAIKEKKELGAKVKGYGIFIILDDDNTPAKPKSQDDYLRSVLRQMADYFEKEVINEAPRKFLDYYVPQGRKPPVNSGEKTVRKSVVTPAVIEATAEKQPKDIKEDTGFPIWARVILAIVGFALVILLAVAVWWGFLIILGCIAFFPELFGKR